MRRALRVSDNGPLSRALEEGTDVMPFLCMHESGAERAETPRGRFLRGAVSDLERNLRVAGSALFLVEGDPLTQIPRAASEVRAEALYVSATCDPGVAGADVRIARALAGVGCRFIPVPDSVILEKGDLLSSAGTPYTVYTPYRKAWLDGVGFAPPPCTSRVRRLMFTPAGNTLFLPQRNRNLVQRAGETEAIRRLNEFARKGMSSYGTHRDVPALDGTSRLSAHLANGTISIRTILLAAFDARERTGPAGNGTGPVRFIGELIWREFYNQILGNFPRVAHEPFRVEFEAFPWSVSRRHFRAWCEGRTGYPIVDAGMRQLNAEGWMHNRVRMVTASFLTKDLHIDWRWGEKYFSEMLIDADTASNNGGWQWIAGTGTDAAPYFRIFNPLLQGRKFDPDGSYVRRYVPELAGVPTPWIHAPHAMSPALAAGIAFRPGRDYPLPVVNHDEERGVALALYARARGRAGSRPLRSGISSGAGRSART